VEMYCGNELCGEDRQRNSVSISNIGTAFAVC